MSWLKCTVYPGYGMWFRVFGVGLHFKRAHPGGDGMLFSERYKLDPSITVFGWRIKVLR
jgi:hypothetical protein